MTITLSISTTDRLNIVDAILDTVGKVQVVRFVPLSDGTLLLMLAHQGHVRFDLITDSHDLFHPHLMQDVSALIEADLKSHRLGW